jgi:hypothetical protein
MKTPEHDEGFKEPERKRRNSTEGYRTWPRNKAQLDIGMQG